MATEISAEPPDWPEWQPAMVTGREWKDTDEDLPIRMYGPQIWSQEIGWGPVFDGDKNWRVVRAMNQRFPEENVSREYETFLCFERLIVHDRALRNHRNSYGCCRRQTADGGWSGQAIHDGRSAILGRCGG